MTFTFDLIESISPEPFSKSKLLDINIDVVPPSPSLSTSSTLEELESDYSSLPSSPPKDSLLQTFLAAHRRVQELGTNPTPPQITGNNLSIPLISAIARYATPVHLDASLATRRRVDTSRGGSANPRTQDLGFALLQTHQIGVMPTSLSSSSTSTSHTPLPLLDPSSHTMPIAWIRAALLIHINALIQVHSIRQELLESMIALLTQNILPVVPMRGDDESFSSYITGTIIGEPCIAVYTPPQNNSTRPKILPAPQALKQASIEPLVLEPSEHLGLLNGTAFSAGIASLAIDDAVHLVLLANVCTALATEALLGTRGSYVPFVHDVCRPHPGQIESARLILSLLSGSRLASGEHEDEMSIEEDVGTLRQDRYPLRTSPQFLGPQMEDILSAWETITIECNAHNTSDTIPTNAQSLTNTMDKTRLALSHIGKLLFAQSTELLNPVSNRGLPPNLASTDPSINYHCKGLDIGMAAYVSELGYLAGGVGIYGVGVSSLAVVSARATMQSLDVLTMLIASYIYILCQALDLRAMAAEFQKGIEEIISTELSTLFSPHIPPSQLTPLTSAIQRAFRTSIEETSRMDAVGRMERASQSSSGALLDFMSSRPRLVSALPLSELTSLQSRLATKSTNLLLSTRTAYLCGERGAAPASGWLGNTRALYEFVRVGLGIRMHGVENLRRFEGGLGVDGNVGQGVSVIYEAIRDGQMRDVVAGLF